MTKTLKTIAMSTLAAVALAATIGFTGAADAKTIKGGEISKMPVFEDIARGYNPNRDVARGARPAALDLARGLVPDRGVERGDNPNRDVARGTAAKRLA